MKIPLLVAPACALLLAVLLAAPARAEDPAAPAAAAAGLKMAVIDLRRALADTEDGLRMKSKMTELQDQRENDLGNKEKEYNKAKDELERLAKDGKTPDAELRKKYAGLEKLGMELQAQTLGVRRELMQREQELMTPIVNKLNALVRQLATQESYDIVVSRDAVPYFRGDLEITDRIIQMYNASASALPPEEPKPKDKRPRAHNVHNAPGPAAPAKPGKAVKAQKPAEKKKR